MAREAWLRSEDHEKFASAAVKCEHPYALCMSDGYCHYDGECFRSNLAALKAACRAIEAAAADQPGDIAVNMIDAVKWLKEQLAEALLAKAESR